MSKFALKAYNRFTKDAEVGALAVAHFLLGHLCFYEYASQIFVQTFKGASGRVLCFPFKTTHLLHSTHIQVSVGSVKTLRTPSLYGSFTSMSEQDNAILDATMTTQDEVHEVLLGLFYP